jgi:hypothetical protein
VGASAVGAVVDGRAALEEGEAADAIETAVTRWYIKLKFRSAPLRDALSEDGESRPGASTRG